LPIITIGIVLVAFMAAWVAGVWVVQITCGCHFKISSVSDGRRS
jgi:hypothetical protein